MANTVLWITPETQGGINNYTKEYMEALNGLSNPTFVFLPPWLKPLNEKSDKEELINFIEKEKPDIIHFQHEYGIWGSKNPPFYFFPRFVKEIKAKFPNIKLVATPHTVLGSEDQYSVHGKMAYLKLILNKTCMGFLQNLWNKKSWENMDAVIVHSKSQIEKIYNNSKTLVLNIPVYVPIFKKNQSQSISKFKKTEGKKTLLVFGYFTNYKGQDVAVKALKFLPQDYILILAGDVRDPKDQSYYDSVQELIKKEGLENRVQTTGYISADQMDSIFEMADLILIPFRKTYGSASITLGLARGCVTLASNIPLNLEIAERVPGCIEFFKSENPDDLAKQTQKLINNPVMLNSIKNQSLLYAEKYSATAMALKHLELYKQLTVL